MLKIFQQLLQRPFVYSLTSLTIFAALPATAVNFTLGDRNSTANFDNNFGTGFVSWTIDGVEQISQTATYFRIGDSAGQTLVEELSAALTEEVLSLSSNKASVKYTDLSGNFALQFDYALKGSILGSQKSYLSQTMTITNTSDDLLDFRLFQYNDFNVDGLAEPNRLHINDTTFTAIQQNPNPLSVRIGTFVTLVPTSASADLVPNLIDFSPTALNNTLDNPINLSGPLDLKGGDVSYAYQWNLNIAPNESVVVTQTALAVPEPSTTLAMLLLFGTLGLLKVGKSSQ